MNRSIIVLSGPSGSLVISGNSDKGVFETAKGLLPGGFDHPDAMGQYELLTLDHGERYQDGEFTCEVHVGDVVHQLQSPSLYLLRHNRRMLESI